MINCNSVVVENGRFQCKFLAKFGIIALISIVGTVYRVIYRSQALRERLPGIYWKLRQMGDLDLLYFIVEDIVEPLIDIRLLKNQDEEDFNQVIDILVDEETL